MDNVDIKSRVFFGILGIIALVFFLLFLHAIITSEEGRFLFVISVAAFMVGPMLLLSYLVVGIDFIRFAITQHSWILGE